MKYGFSDRVRYFDSSAVRDILKVVNQGNVISFAGGLPDEDLFPVEAVKDAFQKAITSGNKALQYAETEGLEALRMHLVERMKRKSIYRNPEDVLVTSGSQQAIDLFSRVMFNPGDVILTEDPTYLAALQVFASYETKVVAVDSDQDGMLKEDLEEKIKLLKPKCIYVVPTYSNPEGKVWSLERRKMLLELAEKYHVVVMEDDPYGDIQFDPEAAPSSLAALDEANQYVVYTSTFSKTVVPAMRIGWIVGPNQIIRLIAQAKQAADLHTNSISQHALVHLLNDFDLDQHVRNITSVYYERMKIMKKALDEIELEGLTYLEPKGGMFFWVNLPKEMNTTDLLKAAVDQGVAFVPGKPFYVGEAEGNTLRLNFTNSTPDKIETGMKRLVHVIQEAYLQVN
ncbi:2-aminoadipate transaminase [Natronobacillus azotifigens]|uniref:PLP-dependent aminotransferase family protein n=1 Tax=Natronobacillus azotifigens TaxID=472978 RepID=A0A9J6RC28_9BACI|nr:PLP-dependent aminotransferase family protein [Natronobacillus azotifigens]MCZ0702769.1 PLP-dependent aminotransferase family protein [Natronobacillus azotifigens]